MFKVHERKSVQHGQQRTTMNENGYGRQEFTGSQLSNLLFPVQDSTLAADALAEMLRAAYALPGTLHCRFFRKGICDTYRVFAGENLYYLKVYKHGRRDETAVAEEVRLLNHLADDGVAVARPVPRRDGQYMNRLAAPEGARYAVLFEAAPGVPGHNDDEAKIRALGQLVGQMHQSLDAFPLPYRRPPLDLNHLIEENLCVIAPLLAHRAADLAVIARIVAQCQRLELLRSQEQPEFGICHGDLHGGDVCYDAKGQPTLFDFDSSGCGWRALDIGVFLASADWMNTSAQAEEKRQRQLATFLDGYGRIRPLRPEELEAIQQTPAIRHIFLMGFVLRYTAVQQGDHWANEQFIDWHMSWFRQWASTRLG